MQVYKITPTIDYSWGCALVAANNRDEAIRIYRAKNEFTDYQYVDYKCVCNIVDKLTYDCVEPTIILDTVGAE
jgi:hypothetical protein